MSVCVLKRETERVGCWVEKRRRLRSKITNIAANAYTRVYKYTIWLASGRDRNYKKKKEKKEVKCTWLYNFFFKDHFKGLLYIYRSTIQFASFYAIWNHLSPTWKRMLDNFHTVEIWNERNEFLPSIDKNTMNTACEQRWSCKENGNRNDIYAWNQK